nr:glycosyltransferase family 2 protein [Shimia sp. R9_3]
MVNAVTIDVCICTYKRDTVTNAILSVGEVDHDPKVEIGIIVVDNDSEMSALPKVSIAALSCTHPVRYHHAPSGNISIARNACLNISNADWLAFLDDDTIAMPGWIEELYRVANRSGADVVFGPAVAEYPAKTPPWLLENDFHSSIPQRKKNLLRNGHTCNVLMRRTNTKIRNQRFLVSLGQTSGEDTEFFARLARSGANAEIAEKAIVKEIVPPERIGLAWLIRRKFANGWAFAFSSVGKTKLERFPRSLYSAAVFSWCLSMALFTLTSFKRRAFWLVRGAFHLGVVRGCISMPSMQLYGGGSASRDTGEA